MSAVGAPAGPDDRRARRRPARPHDGARRAPRWATASSCSIRARAARPRRSPTASWSARSTIVEAAVQLAKQVDVITLDTEHVPAEVLDELETSRAGAAGRRGAAHDPGSPGPEAVPRSARPAAGGVGAGHERARSAREPRAVRRPGHRQGPPRRLRRQGPGARRQAVRCVGGAGVAARRRAVLEEVVPFAREISAVHRARRARRDPVFPIAENVHRQHILHTTRAPAPMLAARAAAGRRRSRSRSPRRSVTSA